MAVWAKYPCSPSAAGTTPCSELSTHPETHQAALMSHHRLLFVRSIPHNPLKRVGPNAGGGRTQAA